MPWSASESQNMRRLVVIDNTATPIEAGLQIGTTAELAAAVTSQATLCYDTTLSAWVQYTIGAAGTGAFIRTTPRAAGIITIAAGATSGTATVPAGLSLVTNRMTSSIAGSATTAVVSTAALWTLSGTTLTVTVTDPGGATSIYVSYAIY